MSPESRRLEAARRELEQAKRRLASSMGAVQYRLKPANLVNNAWLGVKEKGNNAWEGVREKGGAAADDALQRARGRPGAVSGILAAILLLLAREQVWAIVLRLCRSSDDADDLVTTNLDNHDENYDLTAPTVARSRTEGAMA